MEPFPHQVEGADFLDARRGRALIADSPGLGKTGTALLWLMRRRLIRPVVVVCPATMRLCWVREIEAWTGEAAFLPQGAASDDAYAGQPFVVIHYDILARGCSVDERTRRLVVDPRSWLAYLSGMGAKAIVIDECHLAKNPSAIRTKALKVLSRKVRHVVLLTGTPIVNRPIEAWALIQMVDPKRLPNWPAFTQRFCSPKHNGFGMDYSGASNLDELHALLTGPSGIMIRRRKEDVLDLPPKVRQFVPLELSNRPEYAEAEHDFINYLRRADGPEVARRAKRAQAITKINRLRRLAVDGKLAQAIEWIEEVLESGEKLVAFAVHRSVIGALWLHFGDRAVMIHGDVPHADRDAAIERFQTDPGIRLFIGQTQAAGVGITLTAASHLAFLELPWTPGDVLQCEDRIHRIGTVGTANIYYLLATHTVDEDMAELIDSKRSVLDAVIDGSSDANPSILEDLLARYRDR